MKLCTGVLLLLLMPGPSLGAKHVRVSVRGPGVLPCTYSVAEGTTTVCWGRGTCTAFTCNNEILRTDNSEVTWKASERYRLMGNIEHGDVSLTITQLTTSDSGTYCCRVEIPGWFNDQKTEIQVSIYVAPMNERYDDMEFLPKISAVIAPDREPLQFHPTEVTQKNQEMKITDSSDLPSEKTRFCVINMVRIALALSLLPLAVILFKCLHVISAH